MAMDLPSLRRSGETSNNYSSPSVAETVNIAQVFSKKVAIFGIANGHLLRHLSQHLFESC
jgi:hypothetical protein